MTRGTRPKKVGDLVEDPHITCLDTFSLSPVQVSQAPSPLEAFCQIPADNPRRDSPPTVCLAPGLDVCDFYSISERSEVWVNNRTIPACLVPPLLVGWEFYSLLRPGPAGSSPVLLNPDSNTPIEVFFGRPPGAQHCPSMLFIIVPEGQQYDSPEAPSTNSRTRRSSITGAALGSSTPYALEKACDNLNDKGRSIFPRLLALCPTHIYDDHAVLPEGNSWGLFVGPRHRSLVLLNKLRGRIDVHLLMLFSSDAVFWRGKNLIDATARLYEPFGTEEQAVSLFAKFDPLKAHCGLTNALIPEHIDTSLDGRNDYRRLLDIWPPCFFVSNCSDNLRFLTPSETQQHRNSMPLSRELPVPRRLDEFPRWSKGGGEFSGQDRVALRQYRTDVMPRAPADLQNGWRTGVLQLLGFHSPSGEDSWSKMVGNFGRGCTEVTFAGTEVWHEPMSYIVDTSKRNRGKSQTPESEALAPAWLGQLMEEREDPAPTGHHINWRHTQNLIPGANFNEADESEESPRSVSSEARAGANRRWSVWPGGDNKRSSWFGEAVPPPRRRSTNASGSGRKSHIQGRDDSRDGNSQALSGIPEAARLPPPT